MEYLTGFTKVYLLPQFFFELSRKFANLEEVLGSGSALWFSPGGTHLVYAKFNDTNVDDFFYFVYGSPGEMEDQYPTVREIKYPKVGF